jgi:hypothetical protein
MIRLLFLAFLVLPLTACFDSSDNEGGTLAYIGDEKLVIETQDGKNYPFKVEVAATPEQQAKGLMHRDSMAQNHGMLFVFPDDAERSFWMKNTMIPLDIIFIRADGKIHHIHDNAIPEDLTSITSRGPVAAVLEINAGLSEKLGIKPGDIVKHPHFAYEMAQ